jgi:sporadic carbohydrate cluster 2OG-Fe(II) oxygenase
MSNFLDKDEQLIFKKFLKQGYIIEKTNYVSKLNLLQNFIVEQSSLLLNKNVTKDNNHWLNNIHDLINPNKLNQFRLSLINAINNNKVFREIYYNVSKRLLNMIVGNELAMQKRVNLSIQLPEDDSSLLPVHADTWSGDSPFEAVVWIPLVDCYKTKTMYLLPPEKALGLHKDFKNISNENNGKLYDYIKDDVIWLELKYGEILIFNQSLPHGNVVNKEIETRWSLNCRFKSIFTPYNDKKIGEFFEPITLKPLSKLAMNYKLPLLND